MQEGKGVSEVCARTEGRNITSQTFFLSVEESLLMSLIFATTSMTFPATSACCLEMSSVSFKSSLKARAKVLQEKQEVEEEKEEEKGET